MVAEAHLAVVKPVYLFQGEASSGEGAGHYAPAPATKVGC